MVFKSIVGTTCACLTVVSFSADAALVGRLAATPGGTDYQAYYDTDADLTWLADASLGIGTSMGFDTANAWAASFDVAGVTGWRLPDADPACGNAYNCTDSEMGNLFYNVLGNTSGSLTNTGPFSNVRTGFYWSSMWSESGGWAFDFGDGHQAQLPFNYSIYAWAVQSGDVSTVPVPAAVWLFGSGLLGLVGLARRKAQLYKT